MNLVRSVFQQDNTRLSTSTVQQKREKGQSVQSVGAPETDITTYEECFINVLQVLALLIMTLADTNIFIIHVIFSLSRIALRAGGRQR